MKNKTTVRPNSLLGLLLAGSTASERLGLRQERPQQAGINKDDKLGEILEEVLRSSSDTESNLGGHKKQ